MCTNTQTCSIQATNTYRIDIQTHIVYIKETGCVRNRILAYYILNTEQCILSFIQIVVGALFCNKLLFQKVVCYLIMFNVENKCLFCVLIKFLVYIFGIPIKFNTNFNCC